jgi:hypothetical protein
MRDSSYLPYLRMNLRKAGKNEAKKNKIKTNGWTGEAMMEDRGQQ